jgi:hypothetical protein
MRTIVLVGLLALSCAACGGSTVSGGGLTDGLDAYWKLDGDATDSSGHGVTLAASPGLFDGVPEYMPGKIGNGLYPRISQSDYQCGECVALQTFPQARLDMSADFTISLWAKRSASPIVDGTWWGYGLFDNGQVSLGAWATSVDPAPAYPTLTFYVGDNAVATLQDTTFDFRSAAATDVWTHVIVFRRGGTIGMRINGKETTATFTGAVGAQSTFYVAQNRAGYPWQGVVDEVGKWNRALTSAEMDQLYAKGAGMTLP